MNLGQRIREKRKEKGWSMEKLGNAIGSRKMYIYEVEKGLIVDPGIIRMGKIAFALGTSLDFLFFGEKHIDKVSG